MDNHTSSSDHQPLTPPPGHNDGPRLPIMLLSAVFVGLLVIAIVGAAWFAQLRNKRVASPPPVLGQVTAPTFTDTSGTSFSLSKLDGRIWVADSVFTRCGSICPPMTANMKKLQDWLETEELGNVKLVTFTVDPDHDTPEVLREYAESYKADLNRWHFLTGAPEKINGYLVNQFLLATEENKGVPETEMFIHSDKFVLIDRDRNIRGYYSGIEDEDLDNLRTAIISLSREPAQATTSTTSTTSTQAANL